MYEKLVIEFTGCSVADAPEVVEVMRGRWRVLDGLRRPEFKREARQAYAVLKELRRMDAEAQTWRTQ